MPILRSAALALVALSVATPALAVCDAAHGEKVFNKCKACHQIGEKARNVIGPALTGIVDNPAGAVEGFKYSDAFKKKNEEGLVWSEENLDRYLQGPKDMIPGTKMTFPGLPAEQDRTDVICYIHSFEQ